VGGRGVQQAFALAQIGPQFNNLALRSKAGAQQAIVIGAVEVIDRATGEPQRPKALGRKYLDTLSGSIRLAVIPSNHAAHIRAFIKANITPGATLLTDGHASYPGIAGYRHDPRVVGNMAAHIPLKWIHRYSPS
jgi:hypothetical protein